MQLILNFSDKRSAHEGNYESIESSEADDLRETIKLNGSSLATLFQKLVASYTDCVNKMRLAHIIRYWVRKKITENLSSDKFLLSDIMTELSEIMINWSYFMIKYLIYNFGKKM